MNYYEYEDHLMHYGVKGMRWGVRGSGYYDKRVTANTKRAANAKTKWGKARALNRAEINKYYSSHKKRLENAKTIKDLAKATLGNEDAIDAMNAYTNMEKNKARASRTKLGRQIHKVNAMNNEGGTEYRKKILKAEGVKNKVKTAITEIGNMKTTTLAGRTMTTQQALVESFIPGMGLVKDYKYYKSHKDQFGKV